MRYSLILPVSIMFNSPLFFFIYFKLEEKDGRLECDAKWSCIFIVD